jgi:two-component system, OmpR family, alkaline phosphatase synthesis response regulator PhoP
VVKERVLQQIFVVEDEKDLVELLTYNLEKEGYRVLSEMDGEAALKKIPGKAPDLVLLDLMLPKVDGLTVCKTLKADPKTAHIPVVMLTAKGAESDKIVGLELGADDYVTKPFSVKELLARIRAVLRRFQKAEEGELIQKFKDLTLDRKKHEVTLKKKSVEMTAKEFELLDYFLTHAERVLSRDVLLNNVWGYDYFGTTRTVDVHVRRLREKLGAYGKLIQTVKGYGYLFKSGK